MPELPDSQEPAVALLRDVLGYFVARGTDLAAERENESDPWLTARLERMLPVVNPGLSTGAVRQAITVLRQPATVDLMEANEQSHRLLSRWVSIEEAAASPGQPPVRRSVRFFDFEKPERNEFLAVSEWTVRGARGSRRFDVVLFVNGLPLVVLECKDPADPHALEKAIGDLRVCQQADDGTPRLFHTNHFCLAVARHDAHYGAIASPANQYAAWKSGRPFTEPELQKKLGRDVTVQDRLLASLGEKSNLLDHVRSFAAFDRQGGRIVKKLARYQQWEAVQDTLVRVSDISRGRLRDRGGVVWHTQGSGKSLTMLWLALKLRRAPALENPTLLIVTDRRDLDRQITRTFRDCGFENPERANTIHHLRQLLTGPPGRTIFSTVQKFQDELSSGALARGGNVIVMIDEAHRTEYGVLNARLREALPDACLLAFSGTPLPKTVRTFGSYIHRYTMRQSEEDGATVPILYESRLPELAVWGKQLDPMFEAEFASLTPAQREEIQKREVTARRIGEAQDRIEKIAFDIYTHYHENFEPDGFKAQVAVCSQRAAARYFHCLERWLPGRVALLISEPSKQETELRELKEKFAEEEEIIRQFKEEPVDRLAVIIVVDKYLTGFDAPIERVLYLDRPLQEHTLLQAIARVNRPLPELDKHWGLIVDYWGVAGFLDRALRSLHEDIEPVATMRRRDDDQVFAQLKSCRRDVFACFPGDLSRETIEPWLLCLEAEDSRAVFLSRYRAFYQTLERLLPDPRALRFLDDFAWLRRIRLEAQAFFEEADLAVPDASRRVRDLIDAHVKAEGIRPLLAPVSILSDRFEEEMAKLQSGKAKALRMRHAIRHTISVRWQEDPAYYESLHQRLERIIAESAARRLDDVAEFRLLKDLGGELRARDEAAARHGISAEVLPFFHALQKAAGHGVEGRVSEDGQSEEKLAALSLEIFGELRAMAVIDWTKKEDVQRDMRRIIKRHLRMKYDFPADQIESATLALMELARVHWK